ncbi:MAG: hypothetical protein EZS28_042542, partial [Streblomastix strix]
PTPGCTVDTCPANAPRTLFKVVATQPAAFFIPPRLHLRLVVQLLVLVHRLVSLVGKQRYLKIHQPYRQIWLLDGDTEVKKIRQRSNYNANAEGIWSEPCEVSMQLGDGGDQQDQNITDHIKFWLGFSTACGPFNQIAICKDSQKLWDISIYAREQAIIASNSHTDQCTSNSVIVSPLESIVQGKHHCDFLQDLKVVWLNQYNPQTSTYLAHAMIPPEKQTSFV